MIREIAGRLHMGNWKSLNNKLYLATNRPKTKERKGQEVKSYG
jgi:hypothetical protein